MSKRAAHHQAHYFLLVSLVTVKTKQTKQKKYPSLICHHHRWYNIFREGDVILKTLGYANDQGGELFSR